MLSTGGSVCQFYPKIAYFDVWGDATSVNKVMCFCKATQKCLDTKNIFAYPPTKTAEFDEKNRRKSKENAKCRTFAIITLVHFR